MPEPREGAEPAGWVVSCEHGGHEIPPRWQGLFAGREDLLRSHRGWDPGTPELAEDLARALGVEPILNRTTRLLVETNRSEHHRALFSEISRELPDDEKERLLETIYRPHRKRVEDAVRRLVGRAETTVHVGVHSFSPAWRGEERRIDVAFLYDPRRRREGELCARWTAELRGRRPDLRVRRNAPYRGAADGLTTALRKVFPADRYLGIELEVNQRFPQGAPDGWGRLRRDVCSAITA